MVPSPVLLEFTLCNVLCEGAPCAAPLARASHGGWEIAQIAPAAKCRNHACVRASIYCYAHAAWWCECTRHKMGLAEEKKAGNASNGFYKTDLKPTTTLQQ
jgi:hypothetical protein